ncbi:MAG: twin-arginine translocase subunit TatC [bacterium]
MTIWSHLREMRIRLIRALVGIGIGVALALMFSQMLLSLIIRTTNGLNLKLALLTPPEGFLVHLKIALVAGLFLSSPWWLGQIWAFIHPGLYPRERRVGGTILFFSSFAFICGGLFGYYTLPIIARYFSSFATSEVEAIWSLSSYVNFSLQMMVIFGVVFELPLILYALSALGVVTPYHLSKYRRHTIIAILIVAGLITPPDVFSQVIVAVPLVILYEVGIWASKYAIRRKESKS